MVKDGRRMEVNTYERKAIKNKGIKEQYTARINEQNNEQHK